MSASVSPVSTNRRALLDRLSSTQHVDLVVVGGGATGLGIALDAVLRGLSVVLLESHDFAKGTSSRATKLVHGGVRYLAQGNIALVREALHERTALLRNAPHLASPLAFVMPSYSCWETPFYGVGLKMYDALAGKAGLGATQFLGATQTRQAIPGVRNAGLKGGVKYWDGQFDDARLALALARTAAAQGALLLNYCEVTGLQHQSGKVSGVHCRDTESGQTYSLNARCVVNATGVWVDALRHQDDQATGRPTQAMVAPSQGVHLVVDAEFFPGDHALLVPKTRDGRVLFAVPWLGKVILGTTDTPRNDLSYEPQAFREEIQFILEESARYLAKAPTLADVKSMWVGLRPLVRPPADEAGNTKKISREHTVVVSPSGLVTVTGGKWTTYRAMADDVLAKCIREGLLTVSPRSRTQHFPLVGAGAQAAPAGSMSRQSGMHSYGTEAAVVQALPGADVVLAPGLTQAMVHFAARFEYARTVEDILARRSRLLFLDARKAVELAPQIAQLLQQETGADPQLQGFLDLAQGYLPSVTL